MDTQEYDELIQPDLKPCKGDCWEHITLEKQSEDSRTCVNCNKLHNGIDNRLHPFGKCLGIEGWFWIAILVEQLGNNTIE